MNAREGIKTPLFDLRSSTYDKLKTMNAREGIKTNQATGNLSCWIC